MIYSFNNSLKELGDIESWSRTIEEDMRAVACTLEYTYKVELSFLLLLHPFLYTSCISFLFVVLSLKQKKQKQSLILLFSLIK